MYLKYAPILLLLTFVGCAATQPGDSSPAQAINFDAVEIYLSRANLLGPAEFEQYKVFGEKLYSECGKVMRERHQAEIQNLDELPVARLESIQREANLVVHALAGSEVSFRKPGLNRNFFDPGQATLHFLVGAEKHSIETSLDSISEPFSGTEQKVKRLIESVRGAAQVMCGNKEFFGIGRREVS